MLLQLYPWGQSSLPLFGFKLFEMRVWEVVQPNRGFTVLGSNYSITRRNTCWRHGELNEQPQFVFFRFIFIEICPLENAIRSSVLSPPAIIIPFLPNGFVFFDVHLWCRQKPTVTSICLQTLFCDWLLSRDRKKSENNSLATFRFEVGFWLRYQSRKTKRTNGFFRYIGILRLKWSGDFRWRKKCK